MKYYKFLDIDHKKVLEVFKKYCKENSKEFKNFWNNIDYRSLLYNNPIIQETFNNLNITVSKISIIATNNISLDKAIHKDTSKEKVRINMPIYNCEYSVTNFYTSNKKSTIKFLSNGVSYEYFDRNDCTLVDTFCLNRFTVFNAHALHQVVLTQPNKTRLSCTFAFKENIEHLLY